MENSKIHRIKGIAGTLLFHVAILALLLIFGFSTSLPLPGEEGVEVSLGTSDRGFGEFQPEKPSVVTASTPPVQKVEQAKEEVVTQDTEEAPAAETSKEVVVSENPAEKVKETEIVEKEPVVNPLALYKGKSKETADNISEGIAGGEGDQGAPGGTIDATKYLGKGGFGDGPDWSLAGRIPKYLPKPSTSFSENGTVVVQITVNKYGKVVQANAVDKGSNTTNAQLRKLAEEAAMKAMFNANPDAAEMQRGSITYHFIIKN